MASSQHHVILVAAGLEVFELLVILAVVNDPLEDEFVLGQCTSFVEGNHIDSTTQRNLLWLTYEDLLFLQIKDGVIYCKI